MKIHATAINDSHKAVNASLAEAEQVRKAAAAKTFKQNSDSLANLDVIVSSYLEAKRNGFDKVRLLSAKGNSQRETQQGYLLANKSRSEIPLYSFVGRSDDVSEITEEGSFASFHCETNKKEVNVTFVLKGEGTFNSLEIESNASLESIDDGAFPPISFEVIKETSKQEIAMEDRRFSKVTLAVTAKKGFNYVALKALYNSPVKETSLRFELPDTNSFYIYLEKPTDSIVSLYLEDATTKTLIGQDYHDTIDLVMNPVNHVFELPMPITSIEVYEEDRQLTEFTDYTFKVNNSVYIRAELLPTMVETDILQIALRNVNATKTYWCRFVPAGTSWKGMTYKNMTTKLPTKGKELVVSIHNLSSSFETNAYIRKPIIWFTA